MRSSWSMSTAGARTWSPERSPLSHPSSIPGVYVGARLSSRANLPFIRPILAFVLVLSGAKLLHATNDQLGAIAVAGAAIVLVAAAWTLRRRWAARGTERGVVAEVSY